MSSFIRFIQWNCRSILPKLFELNYIISKFKPHIIFLNETWLGPNDTLQVKGYEIFRCDRQQPGANGKYYGGSAILIKKSFLKVVALYTSSTASSEWIGARLEASNGSVLVAATGYRSPDEPLDLSFTEQCMDGFGHPTTPSLLCGDLNCWHPDLSSGPDTNPAGKELVEWLTQGVTLLSDGSPTHYGSTPRQLDIWLGNDSATKLVSTKATAKDKFGSDHLITLLDLKLATAAAEQSDKDCFKPVVYDFSKVNLENLADEVNAQLIAQAEHLIPKGGQDPSALDKYNDAIVSALQTASRLIIPTRPAAELPRFQMTRAIGNALEDRNRLDRLVDRHPHIGDYCDAAKKAALNVKSIVGKAIWQRNARELSKMASEFRNHQDQRGWQRATKLLNNKRRRMPISALLDNGNLKIDDKSKANLLGNNWGKTVSAAPEPTCEPATRTFWDKTDEKAACDPVFKPMERLPDRPTVSVPSRVIKRFLKKLKLKAPGLDGISNYLLKNGGETLVKYLAILFRWSLTIGYLPRAWKVAIVVPVLKDGKDPKLAASYRPISLLPCIAKLLESIVAWSLQDWCDKHGILPQHQAGFRRRRSTVDPLFRLVCDAALAKAKSQKLIAVFLDFKAAFDTVWHEGLRVKLQQLGVPSHLLRWISDFLRGRSFKARVGNELSDDFVVSCGVPQGSPLSPLLFILYTSDMLPKKSKPDDSSKRVANGTYADDAANWAYGQRVIKVVSRLQKQLTRTEKWCQQWRLLLNPAKCEFMVMGHKGASCKVTLTVNGVALAQVTEARYLGVYIRPCLSWDGHLDQVSAKTKWRIGALRGVMNRQCLSIKLGKLFYLSLINSIFTYAAPVWLCMSNSASKRLFEMQADGLRAALGLPFEADPYGVLFLSGFDSIEDQMEEAALRYAERSIGTDMAAFIRYHLNVKLEPERIAVLESHSPAWRLKAIDFSAYTPLVLLQEEVIVVY